MSTMPRNTPASGVVRSDKGYIIDGKKVNGRMTLYNKYRSRIEEMERELGYELNKRGHRVAIKNVEARKNGGNKRDAAEAELPKEPADEETESEPEGAKEAPAVVVEAPAEEAKKKSPKMKKKTAKRAKK